jgi:hypothetical protein
MLVPCARKRMSTPGPSARQIDRGSSARELEAGLPVFGRSLCVRPDRPQALMSVKTCMKVEKLHCILAVTVWGRVFTRTRRAMLDASWCRQSKCATVALPARSNVLRRARMTIASNAD